jgi:hypothetical protein
MQSWSDGSNDVSSRVLAVRFPQQGRLVGACATATSVKDFLTGSVTVKEIEVFQIVDETALPFDIEKYANVRSFREMAGEAGDFLEAAS